MTMGTSTMQNQNLQTILLVLMMEYGNGNVNSNFKLHSSVKVYNVSCEYWKTA